jgi:hypothetical protein
MKTEQKWYEKLCINKIKKNWKILIAKVYNIYFHFHLPFSYISQIIEFTFSRIITWNMKKVLLNVTVILSTVHSSINWIFFSASNINFTQVAKCSLFMLNFQVKKIPFQTHFFHLLCRCGESKTLDFHTFVRPHKRNFHDGCKKGMEILFFIYSFFPFMIKIN